jgi:hypothetical protein
MPVCLTEPLLIESVLTMFLGTWSPLSCLPGAWRYRLGDSREMLPAMWYPC